MICESPTQPYGYAGIAFRGDGRFTMCRLCFGHFPESEFTREGSNYPANRCSKCRNTAGPRKDHLEARAKGIYRWIAKTIVRSKLPPPKKRKPRLHRSEYSDYLASDKWKAKRDAVFLKHQGICFVCENRGVPMHSHHVRYDRLGNEGLRDLRLLCPVCHAAVHVRFGRKVSEFKPHILRDELRIYAKSKRLDLRKLRALGPMNYARFVALFFNVYTHLFVKRLFA